MSQGHWYEEPSITFPLTYEKGFEARIKIPPGRMMVPQVEKDRIKDTVDFHADEIRDMCPGLDSLGRCAARKEVTVLNENHRVFATTEIYRVVCAPGCDSDLPKVPLPETTTPLNISQTG